MREEIVDRVFILSAYFFDHARKEVQLFLHELASTALVFISKKENWVNFAAFSH
jgi:hypothetical protein